MTKDINLITIPETATIKETMECIHKNGIRAAFVVDPSKKLLGLVTDGDIREALLKDKPLSAPASEIMVKNLTTASPNTPAAKLLEIMVEKSILHIPVVDAEGILLDVILLSELKQVPLSSQDITAKEIDAINKVLASPYLSIGPKIKEFEAAMAKYVGAKHAVGVNSGTSGLHLAIRALNIKDGDEVITTPFSFIASANCALFERAKPIFVDIDPKTLCIDPNKIEEKITPRTKAILPVDVFGHPAALEAIQNIAKKHKLSFIEDSCEALGAEYKGKKCGTWGDVGVFAFYPNKQITTAEGGMIITNDDAIADECRSMRNQGRDLGDAWLSHSRLGYNYRMSELSASMGVIQMERIEEILKKRGSVAERYNRRLGKIEGVTIPYVEPGVTMSWFVYVIQLDHSRFDREGRDEVIRELLRRGVSCRNYFPPIHLEPFYVKQFGFKPGDFPITEAVGSRTIALPFFNNLDDEQIEYVAQNLEAAVKTVGKQRA